jgi:hypothetical protein
MRKVAVAAIIVILVALLAGCAGGEETRVTPVDESPPVISEVSVSDITATSATITWTTDEPATSQVEYGLTTSYGSTTPLDSTLVVNHSVSLSGLTSETTYRYRLKSADASGNEAISWDYTFTTAADTIAPSITALSISGVMATAVTITWTTDELATSQVEYGKTAVYGLTTPLDETLHFIHSVTLTDLEPDTAYHFKVRSKDRSGNEMVSEGHILATRSVTLPIQELLSAPEQIEIDGREYVLEVYPWRDFQPICPPDGEPLRVAIWVTATDLLPFPSSIDANRLWVINGQQVWETEFDPQEIRLEPYREHQLGKIAGNGPKWGPGIYVDVIVRVIDSDNSVYFLKASDQWIQRTI